MHASNRTLIYVYTSGMVWQHRQLLENRQSRWQIVLISGIFFVMNAKYLQL